MLKGPEAVASLLVAKGNGKGEANQLAIRDKSVEAEQKQEKPPKKPGRQKVCENGEEGPKKRTKKTEDVEETPEKPEKPKPKSKAAAKKPARKERAEDDAEQAEAAGPPRGCKQLKLEDLKHAVFTERVQAPVETSNACPLKWKQLRVDDVMKSMSDRQDVESEASKPEGANKNSPKSEKSSPNL